MAIAFLNRRKLLTYLGLTGLGIGSAAIAHTIARQVQANPSLSTLGQDSGPSLLRRPYSLPDFQGGTAWLNSNPIQRAELQGKVVLVQIWTFGCINSQRTLSHIKTWQQDYAAQGLQVIGIHTPEFAFEREIVNVQDALKDWGITYPVVMDNDRRLWKAYKNHYWPHLFLADRQGIIRYDHIGEGAYDVTAQKIRDFLG
jgi:thiol-disulfide isomerase/thioredoxin